jgi:hypothetical protein
VRPTTQTLSLPTTGWQPIRAAEREPGDILVRYGKTVKHAFIYERDAESTENQPQIWVYEAAEPRVAHRRYRLGELTAYHWMRRRNLDDVGITGRTRNWVFGDMIDAFQAAGGEAAVGMPYDRGAGILAYAWSTADDAGAAQDFDGGTLGPTLLVHSNRRGASIVISGAELEAYHARGGLLPVRNPRATTPGCSVQALVASAPGCDGASAKLRVSGSGPLLAQWGP